MVIGLIAFIAGMLAGYLSLKSVGWMCIAGVLVGGSNRSFGQSGAMLTKNGGGGWIYANSGSTWAWGLNNGSAGVDGGDLCVSCADGTIFTLYVNCVQTPGGIAIGTVVAHTYNNGYPNEGSVGGTCSAPTWSGPPLPCYAFSGCITNTQPGIVGYYISTSDGLHNWYSGPLANGQSACDSYTNCSRYFTYTVAQVLYNSDGGTNSIVVTGPNPPGTNSPAPPGQPPGTAPGNPTGGGGGGGNSGAGSNTNLTGGQFNGGMSNLFNIELNGFNTEAGLLSGILGQAKQIGQNTSSNANQIDYRSYLITLTNQGQGHLTLAQVLTNLSGGIYTQIVEVAALSQTNFHWMTNAYGIETNNWDTLTNNADPGGLLAAASNSAVAFGQSFVSTTGDSTNVGAYMVASNYPSAPSGSGFYDLGLRTNTVGSPGHLVLNYRQSAMWVAITPWCRLVIGFCVFVFCVGYIHSRVQEEAIRLGLVVGMGWSAGAIAAKVGKAVLSVTVLATIIGAVPLLVGPAISYLAGRVQTALGYGLVSPLSDSGMAQGGIYVQALHEGYETLLDLMPWQFCVESMIYLFFFDMLATGAVLSAQKIQKLLS